MPQDSLVTYAVRCNATNACGDADKCVLPRFRGFRIGASDGVSMHY